MKYISKSKVRNIGPNSNLLRAYKAQFTNLTSYQYEALIGHLLGDANIYTRNNGKTHGIKFEWGEKSKDYIFHVYDIFGDFIFFIYFNFRWWHSLIYIVIYRYIY